MTENIKVEITCPVCNKRDFIEIPTEILGKKKFGTLKIQIPVEKICNDTFVLFLTPKGKVMGYEKVDPRIVELLQKASRSNIINLIERYSLYGFFSLFHAKLFNYPINVVGQKDFLIEGFFSQIFPVEFKDIPDINFELQLNVKDKNSLIINRNEGILYTPWAEKLNFENNVFQKALEKEKEKEQYQIIKQGIDNFLDEVFYTVSILKSSKKLYVTGLLDILSKKSSLTKINRFRISLIKLFISKRIDEKISQKIINRAENLVI